MTNPDRDLPDGGALADFLGKFLNEGGDFKKLFSLSTSELHMNDPILDPFKEKFFDGIDNEIAKMVNKRAAAMQIRIYFRAWKINLMTDPDQSSEPRLQDLTLKDMAEYAGTQFEKWKKEAAIAVPGSREAENARLLSDYWSIMDEVIKPAAGQD